MSLDIIGYVECHGNIVTNYKVQGIIDNQLLTDILVGHLMVQ